MLLLYSNPSPSTMTPEEETRCQVCGAIFEESSSLGICCDKCDLWYCLECTNLSEENIPDTYYCYRC